MIYRGYHEEKETYVRECKISLKEKNEISRAFLWLVISLRPKTRSENFADVFTSIKLDHDAVPD